MSPWLRLWGPAILQMAVIFGASSAPNLQTLPGGVSDKTGHFLGYAILGALVFRAVAGATWAGMTWPKAGQAWALSAIYGIVDELHQRFVPGRFSAVDDWVADGLGAAAAVIALRVCAAVLGRKSRDV